MKYFSCASKGAIASDRHNRKRIIPFLFIINKCKSQNSVLALVLDVWESSLPCWNIQFRPVRNWARAEGNNVVWGWLKAQPETRLWRSGHDLRNPPGVRKIVFSNTKQVSSENVAQLSKRECILRWNERDERSTAARPLSLREALSDFVCQKSTSRGKWMRSAWHIIENAAVNVCLDSRSSRHVMSSPAWRASVQSWRNWRRGRARDAVHGCLTCARKFLAGANENKQKNKQTH